MVSIREIHTDSVHVLDDPDAIFPRIGLGVWIERVGGADSVDFRGAIE
jgi:hypothetical protein